LRRPEIYLPLLLLIVLPGCAFSAHLANSLPEPTPRSLFGVPGDFDAENCAPRADWGAYTVQRGDTLSSLARRTGSTIAELMTANCLADPDLVMLDQALLVPRQPDPPATQPVEVICPPLPPSTGAGRPLINPYRTFDAICYELEAGARVNIIWFEVPADATTVSFYFRQTGDDEPLLLGTDATLSDGASIHWSAIATGYGHLYAESDSDDLPVSDVIGAYAD
jgi:hypothetical protein